MTVKSLHSLVSICIPCYNAEATIAKTVDSILAQTYSNIEIIVSDNQSSDNTKQVVSTYENQGVRLVEGDERIFGGVDNWDNVLYQGNGEFLCLYHADDLYEPNIIEKEVCFLMANQDVGTVLTLKPPIDENGWKKRDFLERVCLWLLYWFKALKLKKSKVFFA